MEAEKENMQMQMKPMRRLTSLRRNPEKDMSIESFMNEFLAQEPNSQLSSVKDGNSAQKKNSRRHDIYSGGLRETNSLQNHEDREVMKGTTEKYQSQGPIAGLSRHRAVQPDVHTVSKPSRDCNALQADDLEDQTFNNPFRRFGQRRRSSVLSTQGDGEIADSNPFATNIFKNSFRRRSKMMQSLEQSPQRQVDTQQQDLDVNGPRRRSGRLLQLGDISESGTSFCSGLDKTHGERSVGSMISEQRESSKSFAASQYSKSMKLITKCTKPVESPVVDVIGAKKPFRRGLMAGGKNDAFEKLRPLIEKAKEQRQIALSESNAATTPKMRQTPIRRGLTSAHKDLFMSSKKKQGKRQVSHQDMEGDYTNFSNQGMCERTLQLGSDVEDAQDGGNVFLRNFEDQTLNNPFRKLGQRRRSSIVSIQESALQDSKPLASNAFKSNLRRRSRLQNLEQSSFEEAQSQQPDLDMQGPIRRSARLTQLDDIAEKRGTSLLSATERNEEDKSVMSEKEDNFNRLASLQFSKNMRLIGSGSKKSNSVASLSLRSNSSKKTRGTLMSGGKNEALAKLAPLLEKAKEQHRLALLKSSGSKQTPRAKLTPLRMGLGSIYRRGLSRSSHRKQESRIVSSDEKMEDKNDLFQKSKECCRTLQFESGDEGDDSEDITTPLEEMDITNMISGSSILKGTTIETKESKAPAIKKSLLQISSVNLKRRNQTVAQNVASQETTHIDGARDEDEFKSAGDFENEWLQDEGELVEKGVKRNAVSKRTEGVTVARSDTKKNITNIPNEESKKVKFTGENPAAKASKAKTPRFKIAKKSTKIGTISSVRPVIAKPGIKTTRTPSTHRRSRSLKKTEVLHVYSQAEEKMVQTSPPADKCDASTNTKIAFAWGKSLDPELMKEVETLSKEQDEIAKEAELVRERTAARRKRMREAGMMDSFVATISPLKRLKAMIQEKEVCNQSTKEENYAEDMASQAPANKSVQFSETSIFYDAPELDDHHEEMETPDTSVQECSSLNASQTHWNFVKHDNRFLQTPVSVSRKISCEPKNEEEDNFVQPKDDASSEKSPFTELAGDCERPSLAPLTPHSRKEVSLLKLSLRKQLEQLYD